MGQAPSAEEAVALSGAPNDRRIVHEYLQASRADFAEKYGRPMPVHQQLDDYEPCRTLGTGSFGRVMLVKDTRRQMYCALKILEKEKIVKLKQVEHTLAEKEILVAINFPFIVNMVATFKDNCNLYMALEFAAGGEMFSALRRSRKFPETQARFYSAQIVMALEYLQNLNIIYRDLKPENVLFDEFGYVKITDFGFAKVVDGRTWTLCGTPEYLAPEIILSKGYNRAVDWWALGVLIYEMTAGYPPFYAENPLHIYEKIVTGKVRIPQHFSPPLRSLVTNLLQSDITKRYGMLRDGVWDIKDHEWFVGLNWIQLFNREIPAEYVPAAVNEVDPGLNYEMYQEEPINQSHVPLFEEEFGTF